MKKRLVPILVAAVFFVMIAKAFAGVTVRYYNGDSKDYVANAVCCGSKNNVTFKSSRTSSLTIQGCSTCKVTINGQTFSLTGGEKIKIKNGKVSVN
jgi:hypothetical protein